MGHGPMMRRVEARLAMAGPCLGGLARLCALLVLMGGCALPFGGAGGGPAARGPAATPAGVRAGDLILGEVDPSAPPDSWTRLLNGVRFTDPTGIAGLAASGARPGRLAGCALPAGPRAAAPVFVLSDDAGGTWQRRPLPPDAPEAAGCTLLADAQLPDTFVVGTPAATYATPDAGRSWTRLDGAASGEEPVVYGLVAGQVLATIIDPATRARRLAVAAVGRAAGGPSWRAVDAGVPGIGAPTSSLAGAALDPADPSRMYVAFSTGAFGISLFASADGGASWRQAYRLDTARRAALRTAMGHKVLLEQLVGQDVPQQLFYSPDGGGTWRGIGLHDRGGGEPLFVSPAGRVVTYAETSATGGNLFALDLAAGTFSLLRQTDFARATPFVGVAVDGPAPTFIYASPFDTYALPLPKQ